jgi:Domain of unknown function (DUF4915)
MVRATVRRLTILRRTREIGSPSPGGCQLQNLCGVWAVNPQTGQIAGFLRFEELVQEVFDVELLQGVRYPEIAEESSDAATNSFMVPEAVTS